MLVSAYSHTSSDPALVKLWPVVCPFWAHHVPLSPVCDSEYSLIMDPARKRLLAAERRIQIADAALDVIATRGVRGLTATEIAKRVGVADATLFRHFESMQQIVAAAIARFEQRLLSTFPAQTDDPMVDLREFFLRRLALGRKQPMLVRLIFNDRLTEAAGDAEAESVRTIVERSVSFVRDCLLRAQQQGLVTRDVPVEVLLWMVTGVLRGAILTRYSNVGADVAWHSVQLVLSPRAQDNTA